MTEVMGTKGLTELDIELCELERKCLLSQIEMIEMIRKYGKSIRDVTMVHLAGGEENFDRWANEPGAAEASIERSREELRRVEQEISKLMAQ